MKAQSKAIVASLVVLALAVCAVSGTTYSWWSDTEDMDITVNTGTINIEAEFEANPSVTYNNGTTGVSDTKATIKDGNLVIDNLVANRTVSFGISITNDSTINIKYRAYLDLSELSQYSTYVSLYEDDELVTPVDGMAYVEGSANEIVDYPDSDPTFDLKIIVSESATAMDVGQFSIGVVVEAYQSDAVVTAPTLSNGTVGSPIMLDENKSAVLATDDSSVNGISSVLVAFDSSSRSKVDSVMVSFDNVDGNAFNVGGSVIVDVSAFKGGSSVTQLGGTATVTVALDGNVQNPTVQYVDDSRSVIEDMTVTDVVYKASENKTYVSFVTNHFSNFLVSSETFFDGGVGTESNPYLISNSTQMMNISDLYDEGYNFFKVKDGVTEIDMVIANSINIYGSFDGNGTNFTNVCNCLFNYVGDNSASEYVLKNFSLDVDIVSQNSVSAVAMRVGANVTLDNVAVHGTITGVGVSAFVTYAQGVNNNPPTMILTFDNCYSDATLLSLGDSAVGFVKNPYYLSSDSKIVIKDSIYKGAQYNTSDADYGFKYFTSIQSHFKIDISYSDDFKARYGDDLSGIWGGESNSNIITGEGDYANYGSDGVDRYLKNTYHIQHEDGELPEKYGVFSGTLIEDVEKITATLYVGPNNKDGSGNFVGAKYSEDCIVKGDTWATFDLKYFDITVNAMDGESYLEQGIYGNVFNVSDNGSYYGNTYTSAFVKVIYYDAQGVVLKVADYVIKP